jgi:vitamin B12/bleomycin/antimicrobial peptide transport system ATP-binding/permease protein
MVWVAIVYVLMSTAVTHVVGRRLVPLGIARQRVEADFRFSLMRFRENALAVTLARGEVMERHGARDRFDAVVANWGRLISAQRNLALVTTGAGQISGVVPLLIGAPAYFAGHFTLGSLVQTRIAYEQVGGALAWFVYAYQEIAQWRASVERLTTLTVLIDATRADLAATTRIHVNSVADERLHVIDLRLDFPDGRVLLDHADAVIVPGERIVVIGPAGSGKTILFRALAGTWPYGHGSIQFPASARTFFSPQRPYLPIGTLREIITFPAPGNAFPEDKIDEVIQLLRLEHLLHRLDELESWEQRLSTDEQQRLSFARVLLHEPDWLFIDDATAAVDEAVERRIYDLLNERLPRATVVTLTHRASVAQYHARCWNIVPHADAPASLETG